MTSAHEQFETSVELWSLDVIVDIYLFFSLFPLCVSPDFDFSRLR